ncbi:MAG TPA: membrane protein insertase YidC [Verrucomicrobiae bacterium]|nr:membrane protein insertase YidC [Verrucomicrobiae bacterium]
MDRKSIIVLIVSFVLLMLWYPLVNRLYPPRPPGTNTVVSATNPVPSSPGASAVTPVLSAPASTTSLVRPESPEETVTIENEYARYIFTSHGGGLKLVELKKYPESVGCRDRKRASTNNLATLNTRAPVPAFALLGPDEFQGDGIFQLSKTGNGVRAEKLLPGGVRLVKDFVIATNYLMTVTLRMENPTSQPVSWPAQELVIGTATPISPHDDALLMGLQWYNGSKAEWISDSWFVNRTLGCFPGTPRLQYVGGSGNVVWAAVHNQFFSMAVIAPTNAPAPQVLARKIDLPPPTREQIAADPKTVAKPFGFQSAYVYPPVTLAPTQTVERVYDVFAGPKEYRTLDKLASRFRNDIDLVMGFDTGFGGAFMGFFAKVLLLSMNGLNALGLSYGLCIVAITIIIKLLFWPLTNASTKSMKRMAALQPQIKAIQEKYKDDQKKASQKVMEFMRENRVNPAAGCLPILIQLPIFFGFYTMLRSAIELRGASFLWACDLSQPDTVWIIPGLSFPLNPLPLIMGATQLWQMRLTPPSPGMDPLQQKMMQYMPLMFLFILYNFSSGLTLYWTVQNLLTIAQMKLTKTSNAKSAPPTPPAPAARPVAPPKKKK